MWHYFRCGVIVNKCENVSQNMSAKLKTKVQFSFLAPIVPSFLYSVLVAPSSHNKASCTWLTQLTEKLQQIIGLLHREKPFPPCPRSGWSLPQCHNLAHVLTPEVKLGPLKVWHWHRWYTGCHGHHTCAQTPANATLCDICHINQKHTFILGRAATEHAQSVSCTK